MEPNKAIKQTLTVDPDILFSEYRPRFGRLTQKQVDAINFLIMKLQQSQKLFHKNTKIMLYWWAYVLATVKLETAHTYEPITEYGSKNYLHTRRYWPYIGRGYVQLTWLINYINFGNALGINLKDQPELANDPETAFLILEEGMTDLSPQDPEFTKWSLEDFINEKQIDLYNARKIINPKDYDTYSIIEGYAKRWFEILKLATGNPELQ